MKRRGFFMAPEGAGDSQLRGSQFRGSLFRKEFTSAAYIHIYHPPPNPRKLPCIDVPPRGNLPSHTSPIGGLPMPAPRKKTTPLAIPYLALTLLHFLTPPPPTQAALIITTDTTINSHIEDDIEIRNGATVTVTDGTNITGRIDLFDTTTINITGGTIRHASATPGSYTSGVPRDWGLFARDSSTINLNAGTLFYPALHDNSNLNAYGGSIDHLRTFDNSHTTLNDDVSTSDYIIAMDQSTITINGGFHPPVIVSHDNAQFDIWGGHFQNGTPDNPGLLAFFLAWDGSIMNFYMRQSDLINGRPGHTLNGTFADGTTITANDLWLEPNCITVTVHDDHCAEYPEINVIIVPEPTTSLLLLPTLFLLHPRRPNQN